MTRRELIGDAIGAATVIALPFALSWLHFILTGRM